MRVKYKDCNLVFVDIETTGLKLDQHEIIEIAAIIYDKKEDKVLDEWEEKVSPIHIETASDSALKINGYVNNPNSYTGSLQATLIKFNKLVENCIVVGQNIGFDVAFIEKAMKKFDISPTWDRHRRIDLMSMAWPLLHDTDLPGLGLKHLCDYFNLSNAGQHTALIDCRRSLGVYKNLMDTYKNGSI